MSGEKQKMLKIKKRKPSIIWGILKRYLANSNIHGVRYLVEDDRHWSERLFWLIACGLSWWVCGMFISRTIHDFITHKVDITMETNYLTWKVNFPALHFCFHFSSRAIDYALNITKTDRRKARTMIRLIDWNTMGYDPTFNANISSEQLITLKNYIGPNCTDLFGRCLWNDVDVDCCDIFIPLQMDHGQCLTFNSYHSLRLQKKLKTVGMDHHTQRAKLTVFMNKTEFWNTSNNYFHVMMTNRRDYPSALLGREATLVAQWSNPVPLITDFFIIPFANDEGVVSMSPNERHCRERSEVYGFRVIENYNYHACLLEEQMKRSQHFCGCVSHLYLLSKSYRTCNYSELKCLRKYRSEIIYGSDDVCLPDCDEREVHSYTNESPNESDIPNWAVTKLVFNMLPSPFIRYNRYTAHSLLDVIITVGGTMGLFAGASVLSFIELPYWLLLRRYDA